MADTRTPAATGSAGSGSRFAGAVAVVTGAGRGIGGATARAFAGEGARVVVADIDGEAAAEQAAGIRERGGEALAVTADIGDGDDLRRIVDCAADAWGRLDCLVNNAWGQPDGARGSALDVTEEAWDRSMAIMLKPLLLGTRFAAPLLQANGGGSVVSVSSVHGLLVAKGALVYETGKAAIIAMTRQLAVELGGLGIRFNAVCPGHILTERTTEGWKRWPNGQALLDAQYPRGRVGEMDEVAAAILFLCSADASFITGHALMVDGGLTIQLQENLGVEQARLARERPEITLKEYPQPDEPKWG